jgi:hypothetical protein
MKSTADTLSLSWLPPETPNGVILDYEIKYYERVSHRIGHRLIRLGMCILCLREGI